MKTPMILHHYDESPYAEKVRLMFGLSGASWQSVLAPIQPPRPNLDPLTGGYRRIPVAQQGADIFCDTAIIGQEIAQQMNCPALDLSRIEPATVELMRYSESKIFFAAIGAVAPLRLMATMLKDFGPRGTYQFLRDRLELLKGGTVRPAQGAKARELFASHLQNLEARLNQQPWIDGDAPSLADFALYHPLWLNVSCRQKPLEAGPRLLDWYQRVTAIAHGQRQDITAEQAFAVARDSEPRALPDSDPQALASAGLAVGDTVLVGPADYGIQAVQGVLAALGSGRIILRRDTPEYGALHVHFPQSGYSLRAA